MRSLDYLVQLYPNKTGKELLEIQKQDKLEDEKETQEFLKEKLEFAKDINDNGGYFKGTFGLNQYYYYNVSGVNVEESGHVYATVEKIVMFDFDSGQHPRREFNIEKRISEYEDLSRYALDSLQRVTKEDYEKVDKYFKSAVDLFWTRIKFND